MKAARPHLIRAAIAVIAAVAAAVAGSTFGQIRSEYLGNVVTDAATQPERLLAVAGATGVLLAGIVAIRSLGTAIRKAAAETGAEARGGSLAFVTSIIGYVIVLVAGLAVLEVNLEGLLLGGALTGVVLGIAAQQTIGNFFAGIVLLAVRPFTIGEYVYLKSGPLGGEWEGHVTDMSLFYVHIQTERGPVMLPNAGVLASAVGPGARSVPAADQPSPEKEGAAASLGPEHGNPP